MVDVDVAHFQAEGWVLVDDVVAQSDLDAVVDVICSFLGIEPGKSQPSPRRADVINGIVPIHQHQALWDTRQAPAMHAAFSAIHGTDALWVTMDRVSYKPRISERAKAQRGDANAIHCDKDLTDTTFTVQGVLYLTDTLEDQGAWECVPSLYREIRDEGLTDIKWAHDIGEREVRRVPGKAGSLVIWDGRMPHSSGHNWTDTPRYVQYITMNRPGDEATRHARVDDWRANRAPAHWRGLPHQPDPEPWTAPASLTPLGQRLLGLSPWQ